MNIVILGDSVLFAFGVTEDLGDRFRKIGLSAINLAMGSTGVPHYREYFQRYITERAVTIDTLVVGLTMFNDFTDAVRFEKMLASGGNYLNFIGRAPDQGKVMNFLPWSVAGMVNIPYYLKDQYIDRREGIARYNSERVPIVLPYAKFEGNLSFLDPQIFSTDEDVDRTTIEPLMRLADAARARGAKKIVVVILPTSQKIYQAFIRGYEAEKQNFFAVRDARVRKLRSVLHHKDTRVIDMAERLQKLAIKKSVSADHKLDYHLNNFGFGTIFDAIAPDIRQAVRLD